MTMTCDLQSLDDIALDRLLALAVIVAAVHRPLADDIAAAVQSEQGRRLLGDRDGGEAAQIALTPPRADENPASVLRACLMAVGAATDDPAVHDALLVLAMRHCHAVAALFDE